LTILVLMAHYAHPKQKEHTMRTSKELYHAAPIIYRCELETCPGCHQPLSEVSYLNGLKTVQTMTQTLTIAYRPKQCVDEGCARHAIKLPSAAWQGIAPKYGTYGYDVIAQVGWERQKGRQPFGAIYTHLEPRVKISESQVRYLYHIKYLPLLACHERQHSNELKELSQRCGLVLGMDGLMPIGGEAQLWVVRELQTGWTLRSGWLERQDEEAFIQFLQPIAAWGLCVKAIMSDKQKGLLPAVEQVFPLAQHGLCHGHYFKNAAEPTAEADEAMKTALRKQVRAEAGDLLRPEALEKREILTVTGMIPSPVPNPASDASRRPADGSERPAAQPDSVASTDSERESIVQDVIRRVRYLLTLKGRPPFRLAGVETYERLGELKRCLDQLIRHDPEPRLVQLRAGLRRALKAVRRDYTDLRQAADWLEQIADVLDPEGKPARSGAQVQADWQAVLDQIEAESLASPRLQAFAKKMLDVSHSYAPGLFFTYDVPSLPRTNNDRESEFRDLNRRLLSTTGQVGGVKRIVLKEGAWELIPGPSSLSETIQAISKVDLNEFLQEQQRVRIHRGRFRLHTRSAKQSQAQLKQLVHRWKALPAARGP
jgi:hypothetical protein